MSARTPFTVPARPDGGGNEHTKFATDAGNPLHSDFVHAYGTGQRKENTSTSGLGGVVRRNQAALGATITRPGTAVPPRAADAHAFIASPLPQKPPGSSDYVFRMSSSRQNMRTDNISGNMTDIFADPNYSKRNSNAHIANSERNSNQHTLSTINGADRNDEMRTGQIKTTHSQFRPLTTSGPQRVLNVPGRVTQEQQPSQDEESPLLNLNRLGSHSRKRQFADRDDDDIICQNPKVKRYKAAEKTPEQEFSPSRVARRSSPVSHDHPIHSPGNDGYGSGRPNYIVDTEEDISASDEDRLSKEPSTAKRMLEGTLNLDFDKVAAMSQDIMEQEVPRWKICTDEEWNADGNDITAEYTKIMDEMMEAHMDLLKACRVISATGDAHARKTNRRKETLITIRRRITAASSSVFSG